MVDCSLRGGEVASELFYILDADLRGTGVLDGVIWGNTTCADGSNSDDDDGDNFTCESNFLDNVAPTITLTSPAQGETFAHGETITISAVAADHSRYTNFDRSCL